MNKEANELISTSYQYYRPCWMVAISNDRGNIAPMKIQEFWIIYASKVDSVQFQLVSMKLTLKYDFISISEIRNFKCEARWHWSQRVIVSYGMLAGLTSITVASTANYEPSNWLSHLLYSSRVLLIENSSISSITIKTGK